MKLTTKGRYAVTAMLDLALHHTGDAVALGEVARRQGISLSYLEQIFVQLRRGGLVESVRGPGGGYRLAAPPAAITVADVIVAIHENIDATRCRGEKNCQDLETCLTHQLWEELSAQIYDFLRGITLAELAARPQVRAVALRQAKRAGPTYARLGG